MHYLVWMNNCFLHFIYTIIVIFRVSRINWNSKGTFGLLHDYIAEIP